ncbi:MAG TPA: hypothetical protein VGC65_00195 [Bacteroidia bacterium]|jgi:hypothetical protein
MATLKTRYQVITVPGSGAVQKISFKIPEDFVFADGITFSSGRTGVGGFPSGTVSLSFNSKSSNPIVYSFTSSSEATKLRKPRFLKLMERLTGGTFIEGWVKFDSVGAGAYLKITIKGKKLYSNG